MEKKLNIMFQQKVTTYLNFSLPLCVILHNPNLSEWIYDHFTNIYLMREKNNYIWLDYLEQNCFVDDVLDSTVYKAEELSKNSDYITKLIKYMDSDNYIHLFLDEYYLKKSTSYHIKHNEMQCLLYGYNNTDCIFYGIGFTHNKAFGTIHIPYSEISDSIHYCLAEYPNMNVWVNDYYLTVYRKRDIEGRYKFNVPEFLSSLKNFTDSNNCKHLLRPEIITARGDKALYGMEAQRELISSFSELLQGQNTLDYRYVHLLAEHKKLMLEKITASLKSIQPQAEGNDIILQYRELVRNFDKVRMLFMIQVIKDDGDIYGYIKNKQIIKTILNNLKELTILESSLYQKFFKILA